jgi:hypothetical protein
MIDTVLNLLFRCSHRRITRPITPVSKVGEPHGGTYVVCLDCGKQFDYDPKEMRMGKPIDRSETVGVLPANMPKPRKSKLGYALLAAVPAAVVFGAVMKGRKETRNEEPQSPEQSPERAETIRKEP